MSNGKAVYVLEGTFRDAYLKKNPAAAEMKRNRYKLTYARKDMLQRQEIAEDADGKQSFHVMVTNVKVNPDVDEKIFEYTPPTDVRVQDATGR